MYRKAGRHLTRDVHEVYDADFSNTAPSDALQDKVDDCKEGITIGARLAQSQANNEQPLLGGRFGGDSSPNLTG